METCDAAGVFSGRNRLHLSLASVATHRWFRKWGEIDKTGLLPDGAKISCKTRNCVWGMTPYITQSESILQTKWRDLFQNGQVATSFKLGQLKRERSVILCDEELLEECVEGAHNMPHACGASSHCEICLCKSKLPCSNESKQTFKPRHVWYNDI